MGECELDPSNSVPGPVAGCCKDSDEPSLSLKSRDFLDYPNDLSASRE
jgi:hypothetical protein